MSEYRYSQLKVNDQSSFQVTITDNMMKQFCEITGDCNPLHNKTEFAQAAGYPSCVVYGMLTSSFLSTLAGMYLPGKYSLIHSVETKFVNPVFVGDVLLVSGIITEKFDSFQLLKLGVTITNITSGNKVLRGTMQVSFVEQEEAGIYG